jgi:hypothetical protein
MAQIKSGTAGRAQLVAGGYGLRPGALIRRRIWATSRRPRYLRSSI